MAVLLDLRADRYYGLDIEQTRALSLLVRGWPRPSGEFDIDERSAKETAEYFSKHGLLTLDSKTGKSAEPVDLPQVESTLYEWNPLQRPRLRGPDVVRMARATAYAATAFRFRHLSRTVHRVEERKAKRSHNHADEKAVRHAASVHQALRPFFYTVGGQCLFDSLVLIEFMASHNLFPTWVIGVTTMPFAAHSWVQWGNQVLNDAPEYVRGFSPILAI